MCVSRGRLIVAPKELTAVPTKTSVRGVDDGSVGRGGVVSDRVCLVSHSLSLGTSWDPKVALSFFRLPYFYSHLGYEDPGLLEKPWLRSAQRRYRGLRVLEVSCID